MPSVATIRVPRTLVSALAALLLSAAGAARAQSESDEASFTASS